MSNTMDNGLNAMTAQSEPLETPSELAEALDWQTHLLIREGVLQDISKTKKLNITAEMISAAKAEAKAAITSPIKELVEEAKPEKRTPDYYSDSIDLYSRQCAANSWNKAIDEFEQNLLKALKEV